MVPASENTYRGSTGPVQKRLSELESLRNSGNINQEEYDETKKKVIANLLKMLL